MHFNSRYITSYMQVLSHLGAEEKAKPKVNRSIAIHPLLVDWYVKMQRHEYQNHHNTNSEEKLKSYEKLSTMQQHNRTKWYIIHSRGIPAARHLECWQSDIPSTEKSKPKKCNPDYRSTNDKRYPKSMMRQNQQYE